MQHQNLHRGWIAGMFVRGVLRIGCFVSCTGKAINQGSREVKGREVAGVGELGGADIPVNRPD